MRKRDICLWKTSSSSWEWEPHCYTTGHSIFYITRSLLKLTWSLNKKICGRKKKKRVTHFFQLLNRFLGHISPPPPPTSIFQDGIFFFPLQDLAWAEHHRCCWTQKPETWFILSLNPVLSFRLGLSKRQRLQVRKTVLHSLYVKFAPAQWWYKKKSKGKSSSESLYVCPIFVQEYFFFLLFQQT